MIRCRFIVLIALLVLPLTACGPKPAKNQLLYLTTRQGKQLLAYNLDPATGVLKEFQRLDLPGSAGPLTVADDGKMLYVGLNQPPRIQAISRDTKTGKLTLQSVAKVPLFPTYIDIDATSKFAITASYGAGTVLCFKLNPDRSIHPEPIQTTNTQRTAHACLIDPSNRFVYIPHTTPNEIFQFSFDEKTGQINPIQPIIVRGGGTPQRPAGPRHYAYHPRLSAVYFVNELDSSVGAYAWNKKNGQIQRFQSLSTLPGNFGGRNTCADIHITPNGKFLYASNRGHDSIAAFALDANGKMTLIDYFKTEAKPREFVIDLTGKYLYAAGLTSDKLAAYAIDPETGSLKRIGTYDTPKGPIWVETVRLD